MPILLGICIDFNILTSNNCRFSTISSLFQLSYVYSIGSFAASCYIGNLTSKGSTAYRYSTTVGSPSKAVCTFRSKSANNTGFSISNRGGTNCNTPTCCYFRIIT